MRSHLPEEPVGRLSDAWCCCVRTGRFELALWRDYQDSLAVPLGTPTFLPLQLGDGADAVVEQRRTGHV